MSERVRVLIGVMSTVVFVSIGLLLLAEQRTVAALVVLVLGTLRGVVAVRQVMALRRRDDPAAPR